MGGVLIWIVADSVVKGSETLTSFRQAIRFNEIGFNVNDTMIWRKDSFSFPENIRYPQAFEYMFVFSKGKPKTVHLLRDRKNKWAGSKIHGTYRQKDGTTTPRGERWTDSGGIKEYGFRHNVWDVHVEHTHETNHPAVFPKQLASDHIKTWSDEGDVVLDPFMGSGTTALSAIENKRHYIGFEIAQEYVDIANKRIWDATAQMSFL